jgi:hypothetical protein
VKKISLKPNFHLVLDVLQDFSEAIPKITHKAYQENRLPLLIVDQCDGRVISVLLSFLKEYREAYEKFAEAESIDY